MNVSPSNPFAPPEKDPFSPDKWWNWDPYQSQIVREIRANMTQREKSIHFWRGLVPGIFFGISISLYMFSFFGIFIDFVFAGHFNVTLITVAALLVLADIVGITFVNRRERRYLCSTVWAREKGISPEGLSLYSFYEKR